MDLNEQMTDCLSATNTCLCLAVKVGQQYNKYSRVFYHIINNYKILIKPTLIRKVELPCTIWSLLVIQG